MSNFAQKQNQPQKAALTELLRLKAAEANYHDHPVLHLQRAIGNQAVQRRLQTDTARHVLGLPGHPLAPMTRRFMESRFGHDFSQVRIHVDSKASESAENLNARAFTNGSHIVFGRGEYAPETIEGQRTIAHELAHVVQQASGQAAGPRRSSKIMRKTRDLSPEIEPHKPAKSWFYTDDPTGRVASVYFDTSSTELDMDDQAVLYKVNFLLQDADAPTRVVFEGYADTVGDSTSNQGLSERRAASVAAWFALPTSHTAVEVTGYGEQGPEATADNAVQLGHYRRVDVIIEPPRPTTRNEPAKGDGGKYGSPELKAALQRATEALDATLNALYHAVVGGVPTPETSAALERYFPNPRYRSPEFMNTLMGEISHMRDRINSVNYLEVKDPKDPHENCRQSQFGEEPAWDDDLCHALFNRGWHLAFPFPIDDPYRIVLTPGWYKAPDPASILVHELTHMLLGLRGHPTEIPHRDPYAIQGFIAALGSLSAPEADQRYPERTP